MLKHCSADNWYKVISGSQFIKISAPERKSPNNWNFSESSKNDIFEIYSHSEFSKNVSTFYIRSFLEHGETFPEYNDLKPSSGFNKPSFPYEFKMKDRNSWEFCCDFMLYQKKSF